MPMSSGGRVVSSSECVTRPKGQEIGSTGYAGPTQRSLLTGHCVMATAEHREPCDSRGSCTVLGAPRGEIPPGDSTNCEVTGPQRTGDGPQHQGRVGKRLYFETPVRAERGPSSKSIFQSYVGKFATSSLRSSPS